MGRTVLINYVLDSQLVYCMSSLQLPPAVITQMDKKRRPSSGQVTKMGNLCRQAALFPGSMSVPPRTSVDWESRTWGPRISACYSNWYIGSTTLKLLLGLSGFVIGLAFQTSKVTFMDTTRMSWHLFFLYTKQSLLWILVMDQPAPSSSMSGQEMKP